MRGKRGEMIREAIDDELREQANLQIKQIEGLKWISNLLSGIVSWLFSWNKSGEATSSSAIYNDTMPEIFKVDFDKKGIDKRISVKQVSTPYELHKTSKVLTDTALFD